MSAKIVTFRTKHFVRYSRHVRYLGCPLLGIFTVQCTVRPPVQKKWKSAHISYRKNNQKKNESILCMKKSSLWYWLSKEESVCSKFNSLLLLLQSLGLDDKKYFSARSPFVVRNTAMKRSEVIKSNLVKKNEKSEAFAV